MIDQLNLFNGGLSITLAPHLIASNESTINKNIDDESGIIKPLKEDTTAFTGKNPYWYKDSSFDVNSATYRDYLRWQNNLLWTDGEQPKKFDGTDTFNLGISIPTAEPTIVFNASADSWNSSYTPIPQELYGAGVATDGTDIYMFGGIISGGGSVASARKYTISTDTWSNLTAVPVTAGAISAEYYNGNIYLMTSDEVMRIYNISGNSWSTGATSSYSGVFADTVIVGDKIYYFSVNKFFEYDISADAYTDLSGAPAVYQMTQLIVYDGDIYLYGGATLGGTALNDFWKYEIATDTWTSLAGSTAKCEHVAEVIGDTMYIIGGLKPSFNYSQTTKTIDSYNFTTATWSSETALSTNLASAGSVVVGAKIWMLGGIISATEVSDTTQAFTQGSGLEEGAYEWFYTFYRLEDGSESVPSPVGKITTAVQGGFTVTCTNAGADAQANKISLYRLSEGSYLLVETKDIGASVVFTDDLEGSDLGVENDSQSNAPAPAQLEAITEHRAFFWGSLGDKLRYSTDSNPNYWSAFNFVDFDEDVTGIASTQSGLMVFTILQTWLIQGYSKATFTKTLISRDQGCVKHSTIAQIKNSVLWVSKDGICIASGARVEVLSKHKLPKSYFSPKTAIMSMVYDEQYFVSFGTTILIVDLRSNVPRFKEITTALSATAIYNYQDTPYFTNSTNVYELFGGSGDRTITYKTGELTDHGILKYFDKVSYIVSGTGSVKIYLDGALFDTHNNSSGATRLNNVVNVDGNYYQIEIEVTGTVIFYSVDIHHELVSVSNKAIQVRSPITHTKDLTTSLTTLKWRTPFDTGLFTLEGYYIYYSGNISVVTKVDNNTIDTTAQTGGDMTMKYVEITPVSGSRVEFIASTTSSAGRIFAIEPVTGQYKQEGYTEPLLVQDKTTKTWNFTASGNIKYLEGLYTYSTGTVTLQVYADNTLVETINLTATDVFTYSEITKIAYGKLKIIATGSGTINVFNPLIGDYAQQNNNLSYIEPKIIQDTTVKIWNGTLDGTESFTKFYRDIRILHDGDATVEFYIDDVLINTYSLTGTGITLTIKKPPIETKGYKWALKVTAGEVINILLEKVDKSV